MLEPVPAGDALLHQPAAGDPTWVETNWFGFLIPERSMRGFVYSGFRTNLGVVMSSVIIWDTDRGSILDTAHYDVRVHLPQPAQDLDDYTLANGLHVRMDDPLRHWTIEYAGAGGMTLELDGSAMMPAVTSHMTRLPDGADFSHFHRIDPALAALSGHIDLTLMMRGELVLHGERIPIRFPSNHDHSWSSRPEHDHGCGYFDEGYFGDDLAFHVQTRNTELTSAPVTNGYLLDHGEVVLLKRGEGRYELDGWYTRRLVYELEDERGRTHVFTGEPTAAFVLPTWPNQFNIAAVTRWTHDGETGWGEYKWHWETSAMQAHARGARRP
jgi:hypothetical protein